jgi:hypothetical protein
LRFNLIESALDTRFRAAVEKKGDVFVIDVSEEKDRYDKGRGC